MASRVGLDSSAVLASRCVQAITIAEVADELYSLSPAEFTAARDEQARRVRAAGQRDLSGEIKKLARPTASAWLVNQLARQAPDELARLFDVGLALQEAQRTLAGDRLRELSSKRRQVVADLLPLAAGLAADAGQPASAGVLGEVRATLEAALADPQAGDAVRSGHLTKALAYAGLGEVDLTAALALPAQPGRRVAARRRAMRGAVGQRAAKGHVAQPEARRPMASQHPGRTTQPSFWRRPKPPLAMLRPPWTPHSAARQAWPNSGSSLAAVSTT